MPTTEPELQPARMKNVLHLIDTDLERVYEMPAELNELDLSLARHAAFDVYLADPQP